MEYRVGDEAHYYVCITPGTTESSGEACEDGDGDELCAYNVTLEATGALLFSAFDPTSTRDGVVVAKRESQRINANGLPNQPILEPAPIGQLSIASAEPGGSITARGKQVGAKLQIESIPAQVIVTVPEPSPAALGIAVLVVLACNEDAPGFVVEARGEVAASHYVFEAFDLARVARGGTQPGC